MKEAVTHSNVVCFRKEMAYFSSMTSKVTEPSKTNAVIMGLRTWDCIPDKYRPLAGRVNIVLTRHVEKLKENVSLQAISFIY